MDLSIPPTTAVLFSPSSPWTFLLSFPWALRLCLTRPDERTEYFIRSYIEEPTKQTVSQHYNLRCLSVSVCVMWIREEEKTTMKKKETHGKDREEEKRRSGRADSLVSVIATIVAVDANRRKSEKKKRTYPYYSCYRQFDDLRFLALSLSFSFRSLFSSCPSYSLIIVCFCHLLGTSSLLWRIRAKNNRSLSSSLQPISDHIDCNSVFGDDLYVIINGNSRSSTKAEVWTWLFIVITHRRRISDIWRDETSTTSTCDDARNINDHFHQQVWDIDRNRACL